MRLPIDTVLQPKDHLPQDRKVHLSRILQNLEVCTKIAGENIKDAQIKYKYQYDKRSKLPEYRPAQRVWLYCTKVPVLLCLQKCLKASLWGKGLKSMFTC